MTTYCKKCFLKDLVHNCHEYRELDGSKNNKKHSKYGKSNQPVLRRVNSDYKDGYGSPAGHKRPNTRTISNNICQQRKPIPNNKRASNMFWLWGQFIDHDITLIEPHDEPLNIAVPKGDKFFDPKGSGNKYIKFNE